MCIHTVHGHVYMTIHPRDISSYGYRQKIFQYSRDNGVCNQKENVLVYVCVTHGSCVMSALFQDTINRECAV